MSLIDGRSSALPRWVSPTSLPEGRRNSCPFYSCLFKISVTLPRHSTGEPRRALQSFLSTSPKTRRFIQGTRVKRFPEGSRFYASFRPLLWVRALPRMDCSIFSSRRKTLSCSQTIALQHFDPLPLGFRPCPAMRPAVVAPRCRDAFLCTLSLFRSIHLARSKFPINRPRRVWIFRAASPIVARFYPYRFFVASFSLVHPEGQRIRRSIVLWRTCPSSAMSDLPDP